MRKAPYLLALISFLGLNFMTSCGPPAQQEVQILEMQDTVIPLGRLDALSSKYNTVIAPWSPGSEGTSIHTVVIKFDLGTLTPSEVTYDEVVITVRILDDSGAAAYEDTKDVAVLAAIPEKVERSGTVTDSWNVAASIEAVVYELTSKLEGTREVSETIPTVYREVTANTRRGPLLTWTFISGEHIPIFSGTYFVIAVIEVRDPTHAYRIQAEADCRYGKPTLFGLFRANNNCISHENHILLVHPSPPAGSEPAAVEPGPAAGSEPPVVEPTPSATPPPAQEMVVFFAGDATMREAVFNAVDWPSLMKDQNVNLVFKDLWGEQFDLAFRRRDLAVCQQRLAQAGRPNGYPGFRVFVWPGSESAMQAAKQMAANLSDCGLGHGEVMITQNDSFVLSRLKVIQEAGESALLLGPQGP